MRYSTGNDPQQPMYSAISGGVQHGSIARAVEKERVVDGF